MTTFLDFKFLGYYITFNTKYNFMVTKWNTKTADLTSIQQTATDIFQNVGQL